MTPNSAAPAAAVTNPGNRFAHRPLRHVSERLIEGVLFLAAFSAVAVRSANDFSRVAVSEGSPAPVRYTLPGLATEWLVVVTNCSSGFIERSTVKAVITFWVLAGILAL